MCLIKIQKHTQIMKSITPMNMFVIPIPITKDSATMNAVVITLCKQAMHLKPWSFASAHQEQVLLRMNHTQVVAVTVVVETAAATILRLVQSHVLSQFAVTKKYVTTSQ
ncbi:hypothetical protein D3C72_1863730 [compost metagenome]